MAYDGGKSHQVQEIRCKGMDIATLLLNFPGKGGIAAVSLPGGSPE
jgi:hypothetical protein